MATSTATDTPPQPAQGSLTELVSGIVDDTQRLFKQQIDMVRAEFKEDLRHTKEAAQYLGVGAVLASVGALFLLIAVVYALQRFAGLDEWACWAIVGGLTAVGGLVALYAGYRIVSKNNPLPDKSAKALQENVSWIANPQS